MAQGHAPTLADVEFDVLRDKLLGEENPDDDPDKIDEESRAKATRLIIKKYHLPSNWKPDEHLDSFDFQAVEIHNREQIKISNSNDAEASIEHLRDCLSKGDDGLWRGCQDTSEAYRFRP